MKFEIPPLPYPKNALAPFIGAETVDLHYEKHHKGYLEKLEKLVRGKPEADGSLEDLIRTARGDVFNNSAQVWNHNFYWLSMQPGGGGEPTGELATRIEQSFGSYIEFRAHFAEAAVGEFGSGWTWLVQGESGRLVVCNSNDAENPLQRNLVPLLTLDVWEHAYYLDYRNERARYVEMFLDHLLNWDFVATNLTLAPPADEGLDIQGEGNPEADERYRERATAFAESGRAKPAAERAARETSR
jgi:superoxide dismutase, Fe-Mn family